MSVDDIVNDFEFLDDWEDRYRYVIELGKTLAPLDEKDRNDINKVNGCVSQVWLNCVQDNSDPHDPVLNYTGDSDALIVRGLIAILFVMFSGKHASEILEFEPVPVLN
ncbi:MAG: SufE family protein, partial [Fimbriimonadaceae bacterium]|nr:SufE family protein [Alphaproteobacteria bacterium]